MRYRLMARQGQFAPNSTMANEGMYKPVGGVQIADSHHEALAGYGPAPGRWLVLCEDDKTFEFFGVKSRTETDIEPVDTSDFVVAP